MVNKQSHFLIRMYVYTYIHAHACVYFWHAIYFYAAYQQPFAAMPSESCVGDAVTLNCVILFTENGSNPVPASAIITRDDVTVTSATPNHRILTSGPNTVGVIVSDVTLADDGVNYSCDAAAAPPDFVSSLILCVTGM